MIFKCPNGCHVQTVTNSKSTGRKIDGIYTIIDVDKDTDKELTCPICQTRLVFESIDSNGVGSYLKVHSMSREDRIKVLKKRSADHSRMLRSKGRAR